MNLLQLLVEKKLITKTDVATLEKESQATGEIIEALLIKRGVDPADILAIKGEYLKVPTRLVSEESIPFEVLKHIPEESAMHYRFVPLAIKDAVLEVGAVDPDNTGNRTTERI